jgi:AcrR family transcriptional regulator
MRKKSGSAEFAKNSGAPHLREALLDAAREIFQTEGLKGLSVRRLADAAACTTMAVYSRFQGKDGILGELFDEGFEKLAMAQQAVDPKLTKRDRVLGLCRAYRATAHAYPHHYALMLGKASGELVPSESSQAKALATLEYLADAVAAVRSMRGKSKANPTEIANKLFAFCHGWVSLEEIGFFQGKASINAQFDAAILALLESNGN